MRVGESMCEGKLGMREAAATKLQRERRGLGQGREMRIYLGNRDSPRRSSVVREIENSRVKSKELVCHERLERMAKKSQRLPHPVGRERAESRGGGASAETPGS